MQTAPPAFADITKRDGRREPFHPLKIREAIRKAFAATRTPVADAALEALAARAASMAAARADDAGLTVETVQDCVEQALMEAEHYPQAKAYILYRSVRQKKREERQALLGYFPFVTSLPDVLRRVERDYPQEEYSLGSLTRKFLSLYKRDAGEEERYAALVRAAIELTDVQAPQWEMIAGRLYGAARLREIARRMEDLGIADYPAKMAWLDREGLLDPAMLKTYSSDELKEAFSFIDPERDLLLPCSGIELLYKRYVITTHALEPVETVQEMYLGIALFLAMPEEKPARIAWARKFYDMLSRLEVTMATPTLSNARKPFHQLSSCFIDTVPDDLTGIYRSVSNFASVSKFGGGMGLYFGKVRSQGSSIRGFKNAAGGVIRWIRLANDTAVAVDQLGVRQGAVAVYLDVWHRDLPEFLQLRTNNGDERMKAHDVFPAVCVPDYFYERLRENMDGDWHLFDPHEVRQRRGWSLEDSWGGEWTEKYLALVSDPSVSRRTLPIRDVVRMVIKSAVETGTPFVFNRDTVNRLNPNPHKGMIYSSNLCTEIAQNMSAVSQAEQRVETVDGETVVVSVTRPGDYVVCNLASVNLGRVDPMDEAALSPLLDTAVRALDNVIALNYYPVPYAQINNRLYRPIGLGVSGYHHLLARKGVDWESDGHLAYADRAFENINFHAVRASMSLALEKGAYPYFPGSDWQTGAYFTKRGYDSPRWQALASDVQAHGLRNGYLLAVAPTSSISIIAGTTAGIDPIMNRFYYDEKKSGLIPRAAPDLSPSTYWLYKSAHTIDQSWSVRACGVRQRHIDQGQSMNLYVTSDYSFRQILGLYLLAWEQGVKTVYYIRSKALEVEDCTSCAT